VILLRLALLFCPRDFRSYYGEEIYADAQSSGRARAAFDAVAAGLAMRFENFVRDVRLATRSLLRSPLHTAVIVLTIAIAIGANLSIGAAIEGLLLRPLPYEHTGHLMFVQETKDGHSISYPDAEHLARGMRAYGDLALAAFDNATMRRHGVPTELAGGVVSANYFSVIGIHPALGRFFESGPKYRDSAVISYGLWRERYGAKASAIGSLLDLNGRSYTIAGVAPAGFIDPTPFGLIRRQYWVQIDPNNASEVSAGNYNYNAIAQIRDGVDSRTAQRSLQRILRTIDKENQNDANSCCIRIDSVTDAVLGPIRPLLLFVYGAVCIVLLIACANVANLQISRNILRGSELAVREAIGARPRHIVSQLAVETGVLATFGAVLGLGIAWYAIQLIAHFAQQLIPRWNEVRIDGPVLVYACILVLTTVFAAGWLPARFRCSGNLSRRHFGRSVLVTVEVALATVVIIAAGLVLNGFLALTHVTYGFEPNGLYVVQMPQPQNSHVNGTANAAPSDAAILKMAATLTERLRSIAGVTSVSASSSVPFWCCDQTSVDIPGHADTAKTFYDAVSPGYFRTVGIQRVLGRTFTNADRVGAPCVAVVNKAFARRYLGGVAAIGRRVIKRSELCTVVGVVENTVEQYGKAAVPILYLSMAQHPEFAVLAIRLQHAVPDFAARVDSLVAKSYPSLPQPSVYPIQTLIAADAFFPRTAMLIFCVLAAIALALALAGIYAVVSWAVAQRMHEFGIRKALGAQPARLVVSITAAALGHCSIGIVAGIAFAAVLAGNFAGLLYETSPLQPSVYFPVIALLCACIAAAAMTPALRAARMDPAITLRYE
jgi:predicted permease